MVTQPQQKHNQSVKPHKIIEVHVTQRAADYGVTEFDVYKLIFALEREYRAYTQPLIEVFFTWKWKCDCDLTISGIFEPTDWKATVCICLYDELEERKRADAEPEILYPRHAPIAYTLPVGTMSDRKGESVSFEKR
jgi:hypothetical protein